MNGPDLIVDVDVSRKLQSSKILRKPNGQMLIYQHNAAT